MGKKSRDKGARAELEFAKRIGGQRVPLSGAMDNYPNDVKGLGIEWEVKRRKSGFKQIYDILNDPKAAPNAMAFRIDNEEWIAALKIEQLKHLLERARNGEI